MGSDFLLVVTVFLMPDTVPLHWDENWQIDGYGSRYMFLILAFIPMVIYYGMSLTKHIDPKRMNLEKRKKTYRLFQYGLTVFFLILAAFFEYSAFNPQQDSIKNFYSHFSSPISKLLLWCQNTMDTSK